MDKNIKTNMKILLVDNHTEHKEALASALEGYEVEIQKYRPGLNFHTEGKDLVILSGGGGEGKEIYDVHGAGHLWYQDEIDFVLKCDKPILGICMGFEVIARAYGGNIEEIGRLVEGYKNIQLNGLGKSLLSQPKVKQFESHRWCLRKAPKGFKVLADSETGVEIMKKGNILATQFHPEKGGTLHLKDLIAQAV